MNRENLISVKQNASDALWALYEAKTEIYKLSSLEPKDLYHGLRYFMRAAVYRYDCDLTFFEGRGVDICEELLQDLFLAMNLLEKIGDQIQEELKEARR